MWGQQIGLIIGDYAVDQSERKEVDVVNLETLANYAEILGGIAVIGSLIYVGFQLQRSTQVNRAIAIQQTYSSTQGIYSWHAEDAGASEIYTKFNQGKELTTSEAVRMTHLMLGMLEQYQTYFILNRLGMMDQESFQSFFRKILLVLGTPTAQDWFKTNKNFFRRDFVEHVVKLLEDNSHVVKALSSFYGLDESTLEGSYGFGSN
jgi:hypothetical protein